MKELTGVIPITATPFDSEGRVDEDSIVSLVEFEARCGVHGLNVLGIMGEFHKLTELERRRVAEVFIKSAAGRFPIVVGTSHAGTGACIELSQAAEAAGAAALMVAPPPGLKGDGAILAHYRAVASAVSVPIVVQDEPVTTGVIMSPDLLAHIAQVLPACRYVKLEEPPTPTKITALRRLPGGDRLRIFGGMNGMFFFEELSRGAVGIMTGVAVPTCSCGSTTCFVRGTWPGPPRCTTGTPRTSATKGSRPVELRQAARSDPRRRHTSGAPRDPRTKQGALRSRHGNRERQSAHLRCLRHRRGLAVEPRPRGRGAR